MSTGSTGDRHLALAECDTCGHAAISSVEQGGLRPMDDTLGARRPNCGGSALTARPFHRDGSDETA